MCSIVTPSGASFLCQQPFRMLMRNIHSRRYNNDLWLSRSTRRPSKRRGAATFVGFSSPAGCRSIAQCRSPPIGGSCRGDENTDRLDRSRLGGLRGGSYLMRPRAARHPPGLAPRRATAALLSAAAPEPRRERRAWGVASAHDHPLARRHSFGATGFGPFSLQKNGSNDRMVSLPPFHKFIRERIANH